jgi:NitT/TauT family transport system permease protein
MACEMFVLEGKDFRLPGLGSYIQTAANKGDIVNVIYGLGTMIALIILIDFVIWRPIIVWSQKFRLGSIPPEEETESFVYNLFVSSVFLRRIGDLVSNVINKIERLYYKEFPLVRSPFFKVVSKGVSISFLFIIMLAIMWALFKAFYLVSSISLVDIFLIIKASFYSLLRVFAALLIALLWTLPVGVFIGLNPRAAKYLQGIVQIAASVPATAIFPVIILFIIRFGGGLDIGAILLMLLGTQWYLLFNIIAGASAIPKDLIEISRAYKIKGLKRWKTLILPGIFPYLVNGLITASGGAWNATIVSEYVSFGGGIIKTVGLGALISSSSATGDFRFLLLSTCFMSLIVVSINRLVWKRLFILAKTKYVLE